MLRERLAVRSSSTIHQGILLAAAVLHVVSVRRFVPCVGRLPLARPSFPNSYWLWAMGYGPTSMAASRQEENYRNRDCLALVQKIRCF